MPLEVGQRIGDYEVLALLGAGGMGRVYKVRNIISNREEAMKVLLPDFAAEPELAARFMAEIRTLAGLDHPNIAQLRTAFQNQNEFVMIMELVEGTTLETLATESKIPLDQVLEYSTQVLSALSFAHSHGVTHRDIKPANIMITSHGLVKLMDFGIAKSSNETKLTRPGMTMGSVYYISPEQVSGGAVDARTDIYSFGVTLYEVLTGRKPFQADSSYSILFAQVNEAPAPPIEVNPALSQELNDIVLRAMEKRPEARFQTAEEFRGALKALRTTQPVRPPVPPQPAYPSVPTTRFEAVPRPGFAARPISATSVGQPQPGFSPVATPAFAPVEQQPPAFTPVAHVVPPVAGKTHRGLWIGLGALAAVLALAAVITVLPRFLSTSASQKAAATLATQTAQPTAAPALTPDAGSAAPQSSPAADAQPQPSAPASTTPEANTAAAKVSKPSSMSGPSASRPANGRVQSTAASTAQQAAPAAATAAPAPQAPSPQEIRKVRDRLMSLDARADSVRAGVQQLRSQQQAQGLDIRGDMLAAMTRMNSYQGEADRALAQNDLEAANEYLERADTEVSKLEKFLGR